VNSKLHCASKGKEPSEGQREGEPVSAAAKRRKLGDAASAAPPPTARTSHAGRVTGKGNLAAAVQRAPAAIAERRSKGERNMHPQALEGAAGFGGLGQVPDARGQAHGQRA